MFLKHHGFAALPITRENLSPVMLATISTLNLSRELTTSASFDLNDWVQSSKHL